MLTQTRRVLSSLKADIAFQTKQGFLFVYIIISAIYIIILSQLPQNVLQYAVPIIIFTDPSVLGLIFIGGILMLEKEQGITSLLAVTPLKFSEYISSKVLSLGLISVIVSLAISLASYSLRVNYPIVAVTILLVSIFFTLLGYIISLKCTSLNQFIMKAIPYITLLMLPCFSLIGFNGSDLFLAAPTVAALKLLIGAYIGINPLMTIGLISYISIWNIVLLFIAKKSYNKQFI
jgi:fluoroquinolone transport system permease protein